MKKIWTNIRMNKFIYLLGLFTLLYIFFFSTGQYLKYASFTGSMGLSAWTNVIWNTLHGKVLCQFDHYTDQSGNLIWYFRHRFTSHFSPIGLIYVPFYLIFRTPFALQFFHTFCIALGALPIYFIARKELNSNFIGLLFSLIYLLYYPLQQGNMFTFDAEILSAPFLLFTFYYLWKKAFKLFVIFLILSLMIKENMPGIGFMLGLYIFFVMKNRRLGIFTCFLSLIWGYLALFVIIPHYKGGAARFSYLAKDSSELIERIRMIFYRPVSFLKHLFSPLKRTFLSYLFKPLLFLPLLSPGTLFITLLIFLEILWAKSGLLYDYYFFSTVPFLFVATIFATKRIALLFYRLLPGKMRKAGKEMVWAYPLLIFLVIWNAQGLPAHFPYGSHYFPRISERDRTASKIIAGIPPAASTGSQQHQALVEHLCQRERYYRVDRDLSSIPDYIFIDSQSFSITDPVLIVLKYLKDSNYQLITLEDGFFLFKKEGVDTAHKNPWQILGKIPKESLVSILLEALNNPDAGFRIVGAFSLGEVGNRETIPALIKALKDKDRGVRLIAAQSLGKIGEQRGALITTLKDKDITVRTTAAQALVKMGDSSGKAVLEELMSNREVKYWLNRQETVSSLYLVTGTCYPYQNLYQVVEWEATPELKKQRQAWLNKYKGNHPR